MLIKASKRKCNVNVKRYYIWALLTFIAYLYTLSQYIRWYHSFWTYKFCSDVLGN